KKAIAPFQEIEIELRKEAEDVNKQITPITPDDERDEIERKLKDIKRKLEDTQAEAKRMLGKKSDEQMKITYMDIPKRAQSYRMAHNLDLVPHYNDAATREDNLSAMNIARKVQTGALMPLYAAPGMDISVELVKILNENAKKD